MPEAANTPRSMGQTQPAGSVCPASFDRAGAGRIRSGLREYERMKNMDTREKLERLAEIRAQADIIRIHYGELKNALLTAEIKAQLAEIDYEQQTALIQLETAANDLEAEIKTDVLKLGQTIKTGTLMAVWNKGRVTWDSKILEGYLVAFPGLVVARKEGAPTVTIRNI